MEIRISKESEVPLRDQVGEQIILLIATEKLKAGQALPSVRELARRLKIHHNTVSHAYADLVKRTWLERRRGSHVVVRTGNERTPLARATDLDDLINATIRTARERGYSLQALRDRLRTRLLAQPPDHFLVVEQEKGLRRLLTEEIREALGTPVEGCTREELAANTGLAIGALVATPQYALADVERLVPKDRPALPIVFSSADEYVERIRKLRDPSLIAVVSVSKAFITAAQSVVASAVGRKHTICEFLLPLESPRTLRSADVVFCDSIAAREVKHPQAVHCRLIAPASLSYLSSALGAFARPWSRRKVPAKLANLARA